LVRILAVDDEPDITASLKRGLERQGFEVDTYNDPTEAASKFRPNTYNLALVDVGMPGMGGFDLFREIRKSDAMIKVCFLTAFEIQREGIAAPAMPAAGLCVIKKPIGIRPLVEHIKRELSMS